MEIIDPGHTYKLDSLDLKEYQWKDFYNEVYLRFVKREGKKYPRNQGSYPGTTVQEVLRCCIDRLKYVNKQKYSNQTARAKAFLLLALYELEVRAAIEHGREVDFTISDAYEAKNKCLKCGHVGCKGHN